ncbi:MAG: hypothetical protein ACF8XB_01265 [Planctomycetota bacterium JB042]
MTRRPALALGLALAAAPLAEAQYLVQQTINGGYNPWIKGQTFTPSVGVTPNPGSVSSLDLTQVTFYRSFQAWSGPTSFFYLNVYDGDPVNGAGQFVGSSVNRVDVSALGDFAPLQWAFDDLTLSYGHTYWALVSSTDTAGGLDVWCGMRESGQTDPYVGGNSIAGVSASPGGFTVKPTIDLAFDILLADSVWSDLGNDLPGALGSPTLVGQGELKAGTQIVLTLANAATNSTSGLFIGATNAGLPFFGGTLVPSPDVLLLVPTGPTGGFLLPGLFPAGLPAGIPLHFQVWVLDPTAPQGHAASNAVTATTG